MTVLHKDPHVRNITSSLFSGGRSVTVDINRDTASRLGLSVLAIDNALYDAFGQRIISTIYTQSSQNRVILEAMPGFITDPQSLGILQIPLPDGTNIPLSTLATIRTGAVPWLSHGKINSRQQSLVLIRRRVSHWKAQWKRSNGQNRQLAFLSL